MTEERAPDAEMMGERGRWWASVHDALDAMSPDELADFQAETDRLDTTTPDGLRTR